jgi:predicted nucleotidyltransferase
MDEIGASGDAVRLKTYCYALRSAFALSWVRRRGEPPPMDLPSLMEGLAPTPSVSAAIADLLARKAAAIERDTTPRLPILDAAIVDALAIPIQGRTRDRSDVVDRANALFASIVLRGLSAADITPPAAER